MTTPNPITDTGEILSQIQEEQNENTSPLPEGEGEVLSSFKHDYTETPMQSEKQKDLVKSDSFKSESQSIEDRLDKEVREEMADTKLMLER
jgi:hypothetical protein